MGTKSRKAGDSAGAPAFTRVKVSEFEGVVAQLHSLYQEFQKLAGKHPNDALNKFKLKVANDLLNRANTVLGETLPLTGFSEFSEEAMPTNSDMVVVLSQYLRFLDRIHSDHVELGRWKL
jgi:hypothetical protein